MKRVLFITKYFSPHIGGVERHVFELSKVLVQQKYRVTVLTEQIESNLPELARLEGVEVYRIPLSDRNEKMRIWSWMVRHAKMFNEYDIIHVHDTMWWIYPVLLMVRKKLFITFHGWEGEFPVSRKAVLQRNFDAIVARGVIHVGQFIEKWYHTKADITIYGGLNTQELEELRKTQVPLYDIVFLGRLEDENSVKKVIECIAKLKKKYPSIQVVFVGEGKYRTLCEQYGKVTGFVENPQQYVAKSKVVFASSYLSMLQVMAAGKPLISFYDHALKHDYLRWHPQGKNIMITDDPKNAFALVEQYLTEKIRIEPKAKKSQLWALQQTWGKIAEQYELLWN